VEDFLEALALGAQHRNTRGKLTASIGPQRANQVSWNYVANPRSKVFLVIRKYKRYLRSFSGRLAIVFP